MSKRKPVFSGEIEVDMSKSGCQSGNDVMLTKKSPLIHVCGSRFNESCPCWECTDKYCPVCESRL